jgi:hypothetical protein
MSSSFSLYYFLFLTSVLTVLLTLAPFLSLLLSLLLGFSLSDRSVFSGRSKFISPPARPALAPYPPTPLPAKFFCAKFREIATKIQIYHRKIPFFSKKHSPHLDFFGGLNRQHSI